VSTYENQAVTGVSAKQRRKGFRHMDLSRRLAIVLAIAMFLSFTAMSFIITFMVGHSIKLSTRNHLDTLSSQNVAKVNGIMNVTASIDSNIQFALDNMYALPDDESEALTASWSTEGAVSDKPQDIKAEYVSRVTGDKIPASRFDAETVIVNTIYSAVKDNEHIVGAGVLMEPGAFSQSAEVYAPYMNKEDVQNNSVENLEYSSYSDKDYYVLCAGKGEPEERSDRCL